MFFISSTYGVSSWTNRHHTQTNTHTHRDKFVIMISHFDLLIDYQEIPRQSGYGFIHFSTYPEGVTAALEAVKYINGVTIDGVHYKSSISHNLNKLIVSLNNVQEEQSLVSMLDSRDRDNCSNNCASILHLPSRTISPPLSMPIVSKNSSQMMYKFPPCSFAHSCWNCQGTTCQARSLPVPTDRRHVIYVGSHDAVSHLLLPFYHSNHPPTTATTLTTTSPPACFIEPSISTHNRSNWSSYPITPHPSPYFYPIYKQDDDALNCITTYGGYQSTIHSNVSPATSSANHSLSHNPSHPKSIDEMNKTKSDSSSDKAVSKVVLTMSNTADYNNIINRNSKEIKEIQRKSGQ